jgi:hypothetical protein
MADRSMFYQHPFYLDIFTGFHTVKIYSGTVMGAIEPEDVIPGGFVFA